MRMDLPSLRQVLTRVLKDLEQSDSESKDATVPTNDGSNIALTIESLKLIRVKRVFCE